MSGIKAILIPGNGGGTPEDNWFPYLERELPKLDIQVINRQFPDSLLARQAFWLPFIEQLGADENTLLIGHSSGAIAAMRFAEGHRILGSLLVSAYYTDLNIEAERKSGYFDHSWHWPAIKENQRWIAQFSSTDDPFISIYEARALHDFLDSEYYEYQDQKHFGYGGMQKLEFPELVKVIKKHVRT